jgi:hypothetical protein
MRASAAAALPLSLVLGMAAAAEPRAAVTASSCPAPPRLVGVRHVPAGTRVGHDAFGGISGMDYDAARRRWWLLSDDRGDLAPPRFFEARLRIDHAGFRGIDLRRSRHLSPPAMTVPGPPTTALPALRERIDGEALRFWAATGELLVASEGDPALGIGHGVRRHRLDGRWMGDITLPSALRMSSPANADTGPRANRSLEGLAFTPDSATLWIALESPLLQDGPVADASAGADLRLTRLSPGPPAHRPSLGDEASPGSTEDVRQFVYRADAAMEHGPGESSDNGISEILALDATTLLVLERSGRQDRAGQFRFRTRLYCAEVAEATDVASRPSLQGTDWQPVRKRLLLEFSSLPDGGENFEAMAWGPSRGGTGRTLVVASDNNFFPGVPTVFLVFDLRDATR